MAIQYSQDKKTSEWRLKGPVNELVVGQVTVETKGGKTKTETVVRLSRPWTQEDGQQYCFGFLAGSQRENDGSSQANAPRQLTHCHHCKKALYPPAQQEAAYGTADPQELGNYMTGDNGDSLPF